MRSSVVQCFLLLTLPRKDLEGASENDLLAGEARGRALVPPLTAESATPSLFSYFDTPSHVHSNVVVPHAYRMSRFEAPECASLAAVPKELFHVHIGGAPAFWISATIASSYWPRVSVVLDLVHDLGPWDETVVHVHVGPVLSFLPLSS